MLDNTIEKKQMTPHEISQESFTQDSSCLLDVRTQEEFEITNLTKLGNHLHIPLDSLNERFNELPSNKKIIIYCHHGVRSLHAQYFLLQNGYDQVYNLVGGIDAYSLEVDDSVIRY